MLNQSDWIVFDCWKELKSVLSAKTKRFHHILLLGKLPNKSLQQKLKRFQTTPAHRNGLKTVKISFHIVSKSFSVILFLIFISKCQGDWLETCIQSTKISVVRSTSLWNNLSFSSIIYQNNAFLFVFCVLHGRKGRGAFHIKFFFDKCFNLVY